MTSEERKKKIAQAKAAVAREKRTLDTLIRFCPHEVTKSDWGSAVCSTCGRTFGWWCDESPDRSCHYFTGDDGKIGLVDGTSVDPPHEHWDKEYETDDSCLFCGAPSERK